MSTIRRNLLLVVAPAMLAFFGSWALAAATQDVEFTDVRRHTAEFMRYNESIQLDAARVWWGLTKHLIADLGYDTEQVTAKVAEWFEFINPSGFSGDACYNRGCGRAFEHNGCGGMSPNALVF
jgi:hypothetical protein